MTGKDRDAGGNDRRGETGAETDDDSRRLDERGMVSQGDMDGQPPNPGRKNINPSRPVVPEKPI